MLHSNIDGQLAPGIGTQMCTMFWDKGLKLNAPNPMELQNGGPKRDIDFTRGCVCDAPFGDIDFAKE